MIAPRQFISYFGFNATYLLWKTVSLFNHILQPSQALALFYQSLIFASKNVTLIKLISFHIDIPNGLQLFMIDIKGNVTVDEQLFVQQFANIKRKK
mgnify:CR=1 FL=1